RRSLHGSARSSLRHGRHLHALSGGSSMTENAAEGTRKVVRILIVDDHPIVREGLGAHIARHPDLTVCGEAEDVADALEKVKSAKPDLVIVDLSLKTGQGLDLIKKISTRAEGVKMLVSSMY